jgi:hypothetical protein
MLKLCNFKRERFRDIVIWVRDETYYEMKCREASIWNEPIMTYRSIYLEKLTQVIAMLKDVW